MRVQRRHTAVVAVLMMVGYLAAMVLGGLHFAAEQHVKCVHGEWTHVAADETVKTSLHEPNKVTEDAPISGNPHGHAHCHATTFMFETPSVVDEDVWHLRLMVCAAEEQQITQHSDHVCVRDTYAFAPKNSPPSQGETPLVRA